MSNISVDLEKLRDLSGALQKTETELAQTLEELKFVREENRLLADKFQNLNEDYDELNTKYRALVKDCLRLRDSIFQLKNEIVLIVDDKI